MYDIRAVGLAISSLSVIIETPFALFLNTSFQIHIYSDFVTLIVDWFICGWCILCIASLVINSDWMFIGTLPSYTMSIEIIIRAFLNLFFKIEVLYAHKNNSSS